MRRKPIVIKRRRELRRQNQFQCRQCQAIQPLTDCCKCCGVCPQCCGRKPAPPNGAPVGP